MSHTCHAIGCQQPVSPKMFMCRAHWFSVPKTDQRLVWKLYRPGQEQDKRPTAAYMRETSRIVIELAEREGLTANPDYALAKKRLELYKDIGDED